MNLFDVHKGCHNMNPKPRNATKDEVRAYLKWLADRDGVKVPANAEYHPAGIWSPTAREYILAMPGHGQSQLVTCELLDESGNVVRTMALPQDKRGGIPATAKQVQEWTGLKPVKAKRGKVATPTAEAAPAPEPQDAQETSTPTGHTPEPVDAPSPMPEPEIQAVEVEPAPVPVDLGDIAARIEALERAVATLSVQKVQVGAESHQVEVGSPLVATPTARAKRSPAHERAIRRAWAERAARRTAQAECIEWEALQHRTWEESMGHKFKRRRAVLNARRQWKMRLVARGQYQAAERATDHERERRLDTAHRARRMIAAARAQFDLKGRALDVANAAIAKMRKDMADPSQPERASDIARLVGERDQARTALAAVKARADRQQAALDQMAEQFDAMVSRVTRAEAAMRKAGLIAA